MDPELKKRLEAVDQDEDLERLLTYCKGLMKRSRHRMAKSYKKWDHNAEVYTGERKKDKEDLEAEEHGEPSKMVVPMSFAQVQTYVSFCFLLYKQNRYFYEFVSTGAEDYDIGYDAERILDRDLRRNLFDSKLYQFILDIGRFNIGVMKSWWEVEKQYVPIALPDIENNAQGFGSQVQGGFSDQMVTAYEGNKVLNISPYHWFPDPDFPIADWRRGSFVGDETEHHISQLKKWERAGILAGVEHIQPVKHKEFMRERGGETRQPAFNKYSTSSGKTKDNQVVCTSSIECEIVPKDYKLGPQEFPIKYTIVYANDQRIVRAAPSGYLHNDFTYDVGLYSPDRHQDNGLSLSDVISNMQSVVSFLINSRLTSIRRSLERNLVVDPGMIDMTSLESRSPWITTKKSAPRVGVDKFIRQLQYVDTTANHMNDADMIMKIMQMVTGVNENSMGQFHGGRRSATEARSANAGAAARMKISANLIWSDALAPLGRKLLFNHRQGLSQETYVKILGQNKAMDYGSFKPPSAADLVGSEDHLVFDATLQSEKGFVAQSLQELVTAVISNPIVMQVLPLDVAKVMEEILQLRGVENIERFRLQQPTTPQNAIGQLLNAQRSTQPTGPA